MCGINGYVTKKSVNATDILLKMNNKIIHRGPDEEGIYIETKEQCTIAMAMRRLSIIDLSSGKQPIYTEDKQKVILFNGEIYNFIALRKKLITKGYTFHTNSDTEVVLYLYDCYGVEAFSMLDGMFALSIYDKTINKIFIARDFFGEKPLYYYHHNNDFIWASELKSIIEILPSNPTINKESLNLYFQLTYIPAPYTIYNNIHKLEPNKFITLDLSNFTYNISEIPQKFMTYGQLSKSEAIQKTRQLVQNSVSLRSIADVSLGAFLSGGVDSSIVSWCLAQQTSSKINTFSIGFDNKIFDETEKSRIVAKLINSNHHEYIINEKTLDDNLSEIILNFDEPFSDSSAIATYMVAEKTKQHVSVALTGDGGDEVFGGYNKYYIGKLNQKYTSFVPKKVHNGILKYSNTLLKTNSDNRNTRFKASKLLKAINYDNDFYYNIICLGWHNDELNSVFDPNYYCKNSLEYYKNIIDNTHNDLSNFREIDRHISLEGDMLVKVDRTSMLTSLECRAPFLNKELWNFTNQVPDHYLINKWDKKHILKEAFKEYFPKDFLNKSKKGFGVPVGDWLRTSLKVELLSYTDRMFLEKQAIFNIDYITMLVEKHISGKQDNTFKVWTYYCFQKWYINSYGTN